ncbi:VanW family protein [Oceanobacillus sp. ISL-73]|uniref:VanW family protein n=2 Tax=unclassified Oceanobacillus TaxID=2630292 RepID=UPI001BE6FD88|nr:VanW family protein [Oceanobacillus sp. ISL-74]MBT2598896.1 VanW family protein [Oceanobacillus sp. ISL-74]MBT2651815.1 VanW family protein [Oceanobacillus sp. ISL-73]
MKVYCLIFFICLIIMVPKVTNAGIIELYIDERERGNLDLNQYQLLGNEGFLNLQKLYSFMDELQNEVYTEPKDAYYDSAGQLKIEKEGYTLDREKFLELIYQIYYTKNTDKITIPTRPIHARVNHALLREISQKQIGFYTTTFRESNKQRANNIKLATESINNTVLFPGEVFSFNDTVGERTRERGYQKAPVIIKGELDEDIGGGICQVSSTLFNAVDLKGIQITERYAHSKRVPYVPPGRDATVSWWGPDFAFKNLYNEPLLIRARSEKGKLSIFVYSSENIDLFKKETMDLQTKNE